MSLFGVVEGLVEDGGRFKKVVKGNKKSSCKEKIVGYLRKQEMELMDKGFDNDGKNKCFGEVKVDRKSGDEYREFYVKGMGVRKLYFGIDNVGEDSVCKNDIGEFRNLVNDLIKLFEDMDDEEFSKEGGRFECLYMDKNSGGYVRLEDGVLRVEV